MIIAQTGIVGLGVYIMFFTNLLRTPRKLGGGTDRVKTLYYTLIISFFANAAFNEVALSPNSCVLYFLIIGLLSSKYAIGKG